MADTIGPYDIEAQFQDAWDKFQSPASNNFWILGNSFDTILDYFDIYLSQATPPIDTSDYARIGLAKAWEGVGEAWYDDDGWWVVAALKAYQLSDRLGWSEDIKAGFLSFCLQKWVRFNSNAPYVWQMCKNVPTGNVNLQPFFNGGVWNTGWSDIQKYDGRGVYCDAQGNPMPDFWHAYTPWKNNPAGNLGGFQNTVTNALYLIAAARLAQIAAANPKIFVAPTSSVQFKFCATQEYDFLANWFAMDNKNTGLLNRAGAGPNRPAQGVVVRERMPWTGLNTQPNKSIGLDFTQAWAGDQGLVLGGLIDAMAAGVAPQSAQNTCLDILDGMKSYVSGGGTMLNWMSADGKAPGNDTSDYCTGLGAFLRYFTYAYRNCAWVKAHCANGYGTYVVDMCKTLNTNERYLSQFPDGTDLSMSVNTLALMVAAYSVDPSKFPPPGGG